jgi:hypothetical protein
VGSVLLTIMPEDMQKRPYGPTRPFEHFLLLFSWVCR